MWLSKQMKPSPPTADADLGVTTISGDHVGVVTRGEVRQLPVYGPGGYLWTPASGSAVLVIKGGPGGEEQCVAGTRPEKAPQSIQPGEVFLYGPSANSIYLRQDGSIEIHADKLSVSGDFSIDGDLAVNGRLSANNNLAVSGSLTVNGEPCQPCSC